MKDKADNEEPVIDIDLAEPGSHAASGGQLTWLGRANLGKSGNSSQRYRVKKIGLKNAPKFVFVQSRRDDGPDNFPDNYAVHVMQLGRDELLIRVTRIDKRDGWGWDLWVDIAIFAAP